MGGGYMLITDCFVDLVPRFNFQLMNILNEGSPVIWGKGRLCIALKIDLVMG